METNFHGTLRAIRAALPTFRSRRCGTSANITSGAGFVGRASRGLYCSSQSAVEGLSEALANELAHSVFASLLPSLELTERDSSIPLMFPEAGVGEYVGTPAAEMMQMTKDMRNRQLGDVKKTADVLLHVILGSGLAAAEEV